MIKNSILKNAVDLSHFLEKNKVENVILYDCSEKEMVYEYYIVGTALNQRHLYALKEMVDDFCKESKIDIHHSEGKNNSKWILIDCYNFVVNLFLEEERNRLDFDSIFVKK